MINPINWIVEKVVTHYVLGWATVPLTWIHAKVLGFRTEICTAIYLASYLAEHGGLITPPQAVEVRNWAMGAGVVTGLDKLTRYAPLVTALMVKAKALQAERDGKTE